MYHIAADFIIFTTSTVYSDKYEWSLTISIYSYNLYFCYSFHEHLSIILSSPPPWDHVGTYQINNVDLYFENSCSNTLKKLPLTATLSVVLSEKE